MLAAGAGWVGFFFFFFLFFVFLFFFVFSSRLSYLPFIMPHLLGDGWAF